jgi:hypothetical protein
LLPGLTGAEGPHAVKPIRIKTPDNNCRNILLSISISPTEVKKVFQCFTIQGQFKGKAPREQHAYGEFYPGHLDHFKAGQMTRASHARQRDLRWLQVTISKQAVVKRFYIYVKWTMEGYKKFHSTMRENGS